MEHKILNRITIDLGDITKLRVDAIVNAANSSLLGDDGMETLYKECLREKELV